MYLFFNGFLLDIYISNSNIYLYARNHLRSQPTIALHSLLELVTKHKISLWINMGIVDDIMFLCNELAILMLDEQYMRVFSLTYTFAKG